MSLEGPSLRESRFGQIRAQLARPVTVSNFLSTYRSLDGILDPFRWHKGWAIFGLVAGMWLAGTSSGQGLVRKVRRK